jgi:hypothetical protein
MTRSSAPPAILLRDRLDHWADVRPDDTAMTVGAQTFTWGQWRERILRLASAAGRCRGARRRAAGRPRPQPPRHGRAHAGRVISLGAATVPVNFRLSPGQVRYILEDSRPMILFRGGSSPTSRPRPARRPSTSHSPRQRRGPPTAGSVRDPRRALGRGRQGRRLARSGREAVRRRRHRLLPRPAGSLPVPDLGRLRGRAATRRDRQGAQAPLARALLGRPGTSHMTGGAIRTATAGIFLDKSPSIHSRFEMQWFAFTRP